MGLFGLGLCILIAACSVEAFRSTEPSRYPQGLPEGRKMQMKMPGKTEDMNGNDDAKGRKLFYDAEYQSVLKQGKSQEPQYKSSPFPKNPYDDKLWKGVERNPPQTFERPYPDQNNYQNEIKSTEMHKANGQDRSTNGRSGDEGVGVGSANFTDEPHQSGGASSGPPPPPHDGDFPSQTQRQRPSLNEQYKRFHINKAKIDSIADQRYLLKKKGRGLRKNPVQERIISHKLQKERDENVTLEEFMKRKIENKNAKRNVLLGMMNIQEKVEKGKAGVRRAEKILSPPHYLKFVNSSRTGRERPSPKFFTYNGLVGNGTLEERREVPQLRNKTSNKIERFRAMFRKKYDWKHQPENMIHSTRNIPQANLTKINKINNAAATATTTNKTKSGPLSNSGAPHWSFLKRRQVVSSVLQGRRSERIKSLMKRRKEAMEMRRKLALELAKSKDSRLNADNIRRPLLQQLGDRGLHS